MVGARHARVPGKRTSLMVPPTRPNAVGRGSHLPSQPYGLCISHFHTSRSTMVVINDYTCGTCLRTFPAGWKARENHCDATGHMRPTFECDSCARFFGSEKAQWQHMDACNHFAWDCRFCNETWPTEDRRDEHEQDEHGHFDCDRCDRFFGSEGARWQHMEACNHFAWECRFCYETWPTEDRREEHEQDEHEYFFCEDCDRQFNNFNSLQQHRRSRVHLGNPIACIFCKVGFATATGVMHHYERGACPKARNLNRQQIFDIMKERDPKGYVTKLLLQYDSSSYHATEGAWNGRAYECPTCRREFGTKKSLDQHLQGAHMQVLYHCPHRPRCRKEFTTLAAAVNHLESESCGFMTFKQVQNTMGDLVGSNRLLAL